MLGLTLTEEDAYNLHRAIALHFRTDYDFNKYHGRLKPTKLPFGGDTRLKFVFHKLLEKHPAPLEYLVANWDLNPELLNREEAEESYQQFLLEKNDYIRILWEEINKFGFPSGLKMSTEGKYSRTTIIALDLVLNFLDTLNVKHQGNPFWDKFYWDHKKFAAFLPFEKNLIKGKILALPPWL